MAGRPAPYHPPRPRTWDRMKPVRTLSARLSPNRGPRAEMMAILVASRPASSVSTSGHCCSSKLRRGREGRGAGAGWG